MSYIKKIVEYNEVIDILNNNFIGEPENLEIVNSGNIKAVYYFKHINKEYVIKFSNTINEFKVEKYLYELFEIQGIQTNEIINIGSFKNLYYIISEKIRGITLNELNEEQVYNVLPHLVDKISNIHFADISESSGYGWINENGNGTYESLTEYVIDFFDKEQKGFWKDWYELFEDSSLNYNSFNSLYKEMVSLLKYCEDKRYIVHGDFHFGNIITDISKVTGVIDWGNVMYGDFIFDIGTIHMQFPKYNIDKLFREYYKNKKINISNYEERFICNSLIKGLDALRFSGKMGWKNSCISIERYLFDLLNEKY